MGDNLTLALSTPPKRLSSAFRIPPYYLEVDIDRTPTGTPTFVMRWVDYTGKYGLAYQLSNSLAGMYFNDSTSIILSDGNFDYLSSTNETISGAIAEHPTSLAKKIKLALRYKGYMTDNLHGSDPTPTTIDSKIFLADFLRVANAVLFRMSDDIFQVVPFPSQLIRLTLRITRNWCCGMRGGR
jgi:hypothetical protein